MTDLNKLINDIISEYESRFKRLNIYLSETDNTLLMCESTDQSDTFNLSGYRITADTKDDDIKNWINSIYKNYLNVARVNSWIKDNDHNKNFNVTYIYDIEKSKKKFSTIYDWDFNNVEIALSEESLNILNNKVDNLFDSIDCHNYSDFGDFLKNYENDKLAIGIEVKFGTNIVDALGESQLKRKNIIDMLHEVKDRSGIVTANSILISKTLNVVCRFNWLIDFNQLTTSVELDGNRMFSTKDMQFIHDSDILTGITKLYKPSFKEIFDKGN